MAHEIVEANGGVDDVMLIGLQTGGVPLAERLRDALLEIEGVPVPVGKLDVAFHRDDIGRSEEHKSELQSLMRISYAVFCLKKKKTSTKHDTIVPSNKET